MGKPSRVGTTDDRRDWNSEPKCPTNFDDGAHIWEATGYDRKCTIYIAHILGLLVVSTELSVEDDAIIGEVEGNEMR